MSLLIVLHLLSASLMASSLETPVVMTQNPELLQIDAELRELRGMKRGFEARALRHENYAEYLQFDDQAYLETRRHLQLAEENRQKAARVQETIDALEARREKIIRSGRG